MGNKLATTERVKEKYREENHQLEDLRKKLMGENKKARTEYETLKFDMNSVQDEYQEYKHKFEEIEHSNRSLLDRQEIGKELKTKIMEENKLLQGRIDNLENAQSDLMRTSM